MTFTIQPHEEAVVGLIMFGGVGCCLSRHRHVDVCSADVGEDGHLPGDALQAVRKTPQRGSLLQREVFSSTDTEPRLSLCDEGMFLLRSSVLHSSVPR